MHATFNATISSFQKIKAIDNAWTTEDYKALLVLMDIDEGIEAMSQAELKEMCHMALSDLEPNEAANIVLTHLFADTLAEGEITEGKIDQISHDIVDDRLWEEYSDCLFHERFFNAHGLLRSAFNGTFAEPTGVKFTLTLSTTHADGFSVLAEPAEASLVRLLANGLDEHEILNRLYEEQIAGDTFVEAPGILWIVKPLSHTEQSMSYELVSSEFWFGRLANIDTFEATTHADKDPEAEDD